MINRQYCASTFCINFRKKTVLLMYNRKLNKWLQPGGHIEKNETPMETAMREALEETGVKVKIIGPSLDGKNIEPIAVSHYLNRVGDMIDIQYLSIPLTEELKNDENNKTVWYPLVELLESKDIEQEIKDKVQTLYKKYKDIV